MTASEKAWLEAVEQHPFTNASFKRGKGCSYCHYSGYQGRIGVFELLPISAELTDALRHNDTSAFYHLAVKQPLYRSLLHTGLDLAACGVTTVEEIIHMAGEI